MDIIKLVHDLRTRLTEYRYARKDSVTSIDINAIEIAVCLVEYATQYQRPISPNEENWLAGYQLSYLLDGGDWEDLSTMYSQLVTEFKKSKLLSVISFSA